MTANAENEHNRVFIEEQDASHLHFPHNSQHTTISLRIALFRLFRLLAYLNYTRRTSLQARSPVIHYSRTRLVVRVPSAAYSPADSV